MINKKANSANGNTFKKACILGFFLCISGALFSCTTPSEYSEQDEPDAFDRFDDNGTVTYTSSIGLPFIRNRVEQELTHLINVSQTGTRCIASSNTPAAPVLSKEALVKLRSTDPQQYWDKVLPGDPQAKHQLLTGVERSLDRHMATLAQTIQATGLNVEKKDGRIVLTANTVVPAAMPTVQTAQLAIRRNGAIPVPVFKSVANFMQAVPVPQFRATTQPVRVAKATNPLNSLAIGGEGGPYIPSSGLKARYVNISDTLLKLATLNQIRQVLPVGMPMENPIITSHFGTRSDPFNRRSAFHSGIDFSAHGSPPVHATARGTVIFAGWRSGYGNTVIIDHGLGLTSRYAHLSHIAVHKGSHIKDRQVVGYQGSTGRSTGNHLHYEIRLNNQPIDPSNFVDAGNQQMCRTF